MASMVQRSSTAILLLAVVVLAVDATAAVAQVRRYQPSRPTVSPYTALTRLNTGGLPNYYAFVRPRQEQAAINTRGRVFLNQQRASLDALRTDVRLTQQAIEQRDQTITPTGKGGWFMNQGTTSTFRDDTRFYPQFRRAAPLRR